MSFFHGQFVRRAVRSLIFLQAFRIITLSGNQDGLLISPRNRLYILVSPSLVDKSQFPRQYVYHSYHQSDETSSFLMFTSWLLMVELHCYCWCLDMLKYHHVDDWKTVKLLCPGHGKTRQAPARCSGRQACRDPWVRQAGADIRWWSAMVMKKPLYKYCISLYTLNTPQINGD